MIGALLLAAGSGSRMKGETEDKLLHPIGESNAFAKSCRAFLQVPEISIVSITYRDDAQRTRLMTLWNQVTLSLQSNLEIIWVKGGKERQDSVENGLLSFPEDVLHVLIHDCARPFIQPTTISICANEILKDRAITIGRKLNDTLRQKIDHTDNPLLPGKTRTLDRSNLWLIETPQGAPRSWLLDGLKKSKIENINITDDMAAIELLGHPVGVLEPGYPNPKITTPEDFIYAKFLSQS